MKKLIAIIGIGLALCVTASTQTSKEYVDKKDALTLTNANAYTEGRVAEVERRIPTADTFLPAEWTNGTSVVIGNGSSASGGVNTVVGSGSVAQGVGASAFGEMCRAVGEHAVAWGSARALGDYCVAMGLNAEASAAYALAIGEESRSLHQYTFAVGTEAVSSNYNSFAVGNKSKSLGQDSMAIGNRAEALDLNSTAIGLDARARGWNSLSVGSSSVASGLSSFSAGAGSEAHGMYSTAIGMGACASNTSAVAIGYNTKAYDNSSVVIGGNAQSKGTGALAMGATTEAAQSSVAIGNGAKATGEQSVAIGRDARATHTASVAIGPLAETTADGTMRIKYGVDEIFLGFWYPKSLGDYIRDMAPAPDEGLIRSLAKDEVSKAKHLPMEDFYTQGSTTVQVFKTTRTVNAPMWSRYPYTAKYKIEGLTPEETGKASGGEYTLTLGTNAIMCLENGGSIELRNGQFWAVGNGNDIFIQNPTNVMFYGAALNRANSKTLPQWIDEKMATAGSVKKVANKSPDASGNVPLTATDVGAADGEQVQQLQAVVTTYTAFVDGSNVVFSITNYLSGAYVLNEAKLKILELKDGGYQEVYNSRTEILLHVTNETQKIVGFVNAATNALAGTISGKADKAWGKYTSAGGEAPSNTVYMTAPNTVFAGGMEYERVAVGEGAICVLTTKGAPVYTQGDEGTFKFQDDGGTNYFGFAKSDSYTQGCRTDGITVQNQMVTLHYDITMSGVPCIWYKEDLTSSEPWEQLNLPDRSAVPGATHQVQWEENPDPGTQECHINVNGEPKGFFKATVEVAGSAKFMSNMPADLSGGIFCTDGQHKVGIDWNNGNPRLVEVQ